VPGPPLLEARDVTVRRDAEVLLDGVSLEVEAGTIHLLVGPNGAGKSTLLSALLGLAEFSGSIRLHFRGSGRIGYVPQRFAVDRTLPLTVAEFLALPRRRRPVCFGLSASARRQAEALLAGVGLRGCSARQLGALSGGELQRVLLANALDPVPELLLLDEPSTGLDPGARRDLVDALSSLARAGTAVLLTTHLFEEAEAAHRVGILDRGRLLALDTPAALKATLGGDVVTVEARDETGAPALAAGIESRFGAEAGRISVVGPTVRVEREAAHTFVPRLVEAFPGAFKSVTLGAPSLEDVFIASTGRRFREADLPDAGEGAA
jgi:ABC-type Mn2+/Zn2+ transport system ATPase subunit